MGDVDRPGPAGPVPALTNRLWRFQGRGGPAFAVQEPVTTKDSTTPLWHAMPSAEVLKRVSATEKGLTAHEAALRLERDGPNELPRRQPPTIFHIALSQFRSPLIYVLLVAALISIFIQEYTDAGFIAAVLVINAVIGGYQEWRAEKGSLALEQLLVTRAAALRDAEVTEIDARSVVCGDILWLESGNRVPADTRLLHCTGLELDESAMTGESLGVLKDPDWSGGRDAVLADRKNMAYAGTTVTRGRGKGVVVATGSQTEVGRLATEMLSATGGKPPLLLRLERFTQVIGVSVALAAVAVGGLGLLRGYRITEMFFFAVALAVSAIPEGLPVAVTVALAVATHRMARRGVIVRKLAAVEGLGSCARVASDKTGTLTCNELTVRVILTADGRRFDVTGQGFEPEGGIFLVGDPIEKGTDPALDALLRVAVLCNEADLHSKEGGWTWRGDPTEVALLTAAHKAGWQHELTLDEYPMVHDIPFEPEERYAATFHEAGEETLVMVKGAPERVLELCEQKSEGNRIEALHHAHQLARDGYRVLALAEGRLPAHEDGKAYGEPSGLEFLGLVGMIDPPRPQVRESIEQCRKAGVQVSMITGDHPVTALAISRDLGLASSMEEVIIGSDVAKLEEGELDEVVRRIRVFARVTPNQKLKIVEAIRRGDQFVAVTGDGVNDAPALRTANIGVAMGRDGTDVARDAADIVISDDNFATIVGGIEEGRVAYSNIRKVIFLLVSTGAAEVLMVALCVALGLPLPLLPVQLLWLNLVTNGIQDVALALEPGEGDELAQPPRPVRERIFNKLMIERTLVSAAYMGFIGIAVFQWLLRQGWEVPAAQNVILLLFVLFENVHIGNCRAEVKSSLLLSPLRSPFLVGGAILAFLVHLGMLYFPPAQFVLGTAPVDIETWGILIVLALGLFVLMEFQKMLWRLRRSQAAKAD